ncbi:NUDIX family hydrolase [Galbibacter marinus]|uniref:NUDIX family hydrolase n=1 Tax=Galbibacter marinus TaxID=555500 RepID=K2Q492_9FLAO|nr:NUDIX domain-containing protein [Galbibacter marinus]EKF55656.1 NUDIX family hydrolase [Galbibacter marinus]
MDELVDILDKQGKSTGTSLLKSEAHKKGLFHATAHVWIYNRNGEILIQKRSGNKETYPNKWDVSVAGHICAGEDPVTTAIRETSEEIGLRLQKSDLYKIGQYRSTVIHNKDLIDCEFNHIYLTELKVPIGELRIQTTEVAAIKFIDINIYRESLKDFSLLKSYVPHPPDYVDLVISAIRRQTL